MIGGRIAKRYARALMVIGQEKGIYERLGQELDQIAALARDDDNFRVVLKTPIVAKDAKERVIVKICEALGHHELTIRFLKLLNAKGRLTYLEQIAKSFKELTDEAEGRVRASVASARELSPEARDRIKDVLEKLTGKEVIMAVQEDESLIGGVVTKVAGKLLDGSVRTQLKAVGEKLKSGI